MNYKGKILVVDDEYDLVKMISIRLEANNYEVITAKDGIEALERAKNENPRLIILDLMLPKMDGYVVCETLKKDDRYSKIPIIMLTARAQKLDKEIGAEVGADYYITKPFEPAELLSKMEELLR